MADVPTQPSEPIQPSATAAGAWPFIEETVARRMKTLAEDLRPGATAAELDATEAAIGVKFPESFRAFYMGHNGQGGEKIGLGLFFGMYFMSLAQIVADWTMWQDLLASDPDTYGKAGDSSSVPEGAIDTRYIHNLWIPFARDLAGNHLGLDFCPGPAGTVGQIINFGRDQKKKVVLGRDFDQFICWVQPRLAEGQSSFVPRPEISSESVTFELVMPAAPESIAMIKFLHPN
jgi:cell wall assembly regulator SMI1